MQKAISYFVGFSLCLSLSVAAAPSAIAASTPSPKPPKADVFKATTARQGNRQTAPGNPANSGRDKEVVSLRSSNSRTIATNNGYVTDIFAGPINFKDAKGAWQPIDDTLVPAGVNGYAAKNRADEYTALLPSNLSAPVRLILPSGTIDIRLVGASGAPSTKTNVATYANALPGATVAYEAQPNSLKETISLASAQAPSVFSYVLTPPAHWTANSNARGGIDLKDSKGKLQAALVAPTMTDAARQTGSVGMSSSTASGLTTIAVTPDLKWLRGAARKFPVVIDPTIWTQSTYFLGQDCDLSSANPTSNLCSSYQYPGWTDFVGFNGADVDRAMYLFPILTGSPIYDHTVPNANILDAELDLTLHSGQSSAVPIAIQPITQSWSDTGATWNNADSSHAWTTPGGTAGAAIATLDVGPALTTYAFTGITQTIQDWVSGSAPNYGFMIRAANESQAGTTVEFNNQKFDTADVDDPGNPHLHVRWNAWGGLQPFFKFDGVRQLDDRMSMAVNVANGQLVVHNQDIAVRGVGLNLAVDRYYNSLSATQWDLGTGWNLSVDCQVAIDTGAHDGVVYTAPDGYEVLFRNNGSGGYTTPPGINADLVRNGDGTFTLTFHGSNTKFNFQSGGCLQSEVDRNGNPISLSYNQSGWLGTVTDTQNRATTFSYNSTCGPSFITQITDSASRNYLYGYDANCDLITYTDPNNKVTHYAYNSNLQMSQITDPNGNVVNFTYSTTYPQPLTQISYVNVACASGTCDTNFAYNSGAGPCTSSGVFGNTVVTDGNGHITTYCYDKQGRVVEVRDANNHKRETSFNANSNVTSLTDAISSVTQLTYDTNNNLTKVQAPASAAGQTPAAIGFGYQAPGQILLPSSRTDTMGNCRAFTYDSAGNLTNVYDGQSSPCDGQTGGSHLSNSYQGDPGVTCPPAKNGELCYATDARGNRTSYAYDSNGNLASITPPSPLVGTAITVDSLSRVSTVTDGKGQKTTYSYDALDRITQILYGGASTCTSTDTCTTFVYDDDGNLTSRVDNTGTTAFTYDSMSRLTKKVLPDPTAACLGQGGLTFAYDNAGNLTQYCDSGGAVNYTYDNVNRTQSLAEPGGSCSAPISLCSTFAFDNDDRLTTLTFPGGATQNMTYDNAGNELTAVGKDSTGAVISSFTYTYNQGSADRAIRLSVAEADPLANLTTSYTYDVFLRLTDASNSQTTLHYRYDANGNRCSTNTTCDGTWTYNAANELTASPGVSSYGYDGNGNLTSSSTGGSFSYNAKNQTTAATWNGQTVSGLTYADVGQTERTAAGSTTYATSPLGLQISTASALSTYFLRDGKGNLIGQKLPDGSHWYYLKDGLGSIVAVINGSGSTVANRYGYDPFGRLTTSSGTQANPWGYAGGLRDATGLVKFGTRYYDPNLGRWTQPDSIAGPISAPGSNNRYTYVGCNPIDATDPTGRFPLCLQGGIPIEVLAGPAWALIAAGLSFGAIPEILAAGGAIAIAGAASAFLVGAAFVGAAFLIGYGIYRGFQNVGCFSPLP